MNLFQVPVHPYVPIGWGVGSEAVRVVDGEGGVIGRGCSGSGLINFFRLGDRAERERATRGAQGGTCQNVGQFNR